MNTETQPHSAAADTAMRDALRALPLEQAPPQLWSRVAEGLLAATVIDLASRAKPRSKRWAPWLALAAGVSALALTLNLSRAPQLDPVIDAAPTLAALQAQSRKLEERLASLRSNDTRYSARAARLEQSLADGLALTDLQLSAASEPQIATQLWQRRVALLSTWLDLNAIGPEWGDAAPAATRPDERSNDEESWL